MIKRDHRWRPILKLSSKPSKASFSKQAQEEKQIKKQYEGAIKALEETKESEENLRLKTNEVHQEAQKEKIFLAAEDNKMKLQYESKMKILDIKVSKLVFRLGFTPYSRPSRDLKDKGRGEFTSLFKFLKILWLQDYAVVA